MKKRKFILGEEQKPLAPAIEIKALSTLLESVLREEKYEVAALIQSRIETIKNRKQ